jgi:2-C-methyl-D-erythritol 4-phosphate cytidylyltransferase/2-C-methyl-D-erythritol 2,4-cyclodiphosphate synthase
MHALTDALFGAVGAGDIGQHFPPTEEKWRGAASAIFLEGALNEIKARGGQIENVDVTIICEAPKVGPHREAMRAKLSKLLRLDPMQVNVKATTTERLGFTGRREGIAAMATASVVISTLGF